MVHNGRFLLIVVLYFLFQLVEGVLQGLTNDELSQIFSEHEIIHPTQVDFVGNFLSYNLRQKSARHKRTLDNENVPHANELRGHLYLAQRNNSGSKSTHYDLPNTIYDDGGQRINKAYDDSDRYYFNITAFGSSYHLVLEDKKRLIADGAEVVWYSSNGVKHRTNALNSDCVHTGYISRQANSRVALTSCYGLAGFIKTDSDEFFIEPLENGTNNESQDLPQRHVVYRRSATKKFKAKRYMEPERTKHLKRYDDGSSVGYLSADTEAYLNGGAKTRNKRHIKSREYNMEVLLTADSEVIEFHGREHVENYLITLMNIISYCYKPQKPIVILTRNHPGKKKWSITVDEIYHDESIGTHINIVLIRLCLLDKQQSSNLIVHEDPSASLKNVCKWAHDYQMSDPLRNGRTHDHAVFLTRQKFGPAGMEGYAHVTGMCHPLRSCTLNHEDGFSSAFVVAHETGHVLGMEHDGEGNKCGDETSMGSIMAPLVQAAFHRYHWSRCSQQELKAHISTYDCLLDDPHRPDWGPTPEYPGELYSMDDQCRFDFGVGYRRCTAFRNLDVCKTLWCSHDDNPMFCKTKNGPPVDGTECGTNMWCFKSHCVWRHTRQETVDGNWSSWSSYGVCSRSCGTGVTSRNRECNNPMPSAKGRLCSGAAVEYDICNKRPCPESRDYRAEQCRYHNKVEYSGRHHTWLPYESEHDDLMCELFCVSKETNDVLSMGTPVADGTPCSYDDPHSICINAMCVNIGCDKVIGSKRHEDECGVCDGDGGQCRRLSGTYRKLVRRQYNSYMKAFNIPVNARKVRIQETTDPDPIHVLAVKDRKTGRYILNQRNKQVDGDVQASFIEAGTKWTYVSKDGRETLTSNGPIKAEVSIMLISRGRGRRTSIHYSYIMHSRHVMDDKYHYEIRKWYPCSVTCGTGTRVSRFGCRNKVTKKWVRKIHCSGSPPARIRKQCVMKCDSLPRWNVGTWAACSKTCGNGGIQRRRVFCRKQKTDNRWLLVSSELCSTREKKPSSSRRCPNTTCPPRWRTGAWSKCSATCGKGRRRRRVICTAGDPVADQKCADPKPIENEPCQFSVCNGAVPMVIPVSNVDTRRKTGSSFHDIQGNEAAQESCAKDRAIICQVVTLATYCSIPGYRQLCCNSCRSNNRSADDDSDDKSSDNVMEIDPSGPENRKAANTLKVPKTAYTGEEQHSRRRRALEISEDVRRNFRSLHFSSWSTCSETCGKGIQHRRLRSKRSIKCPSCATHLGPITTRECLISSCDKHDSSNSVPSAFVTVAEHYVSIQRDVFRTIITIRSRLKDKNP